MRGSLWEPPSSSQRRVRNPLGPATAISPPMGLDGRHEDLPRAPGVYVFKDAEHRVLYVGKAADLRSRVASYASETDERKRRMVPRIADVETIVTDNETEALLLEANLIKRHRPRYNVRFADDKRYPYIKFTDDEFPRIEVTRQVKGDGADYFGPYPHVGAARRTMRIIRQLFEIRDCTEMRPEGCLSYHIEMCTGPCMEEVTEAEYADQVRRAAAFLRGGGEALTEELRDRMEALADEHRFEEAARVRDQLMALTRTLSKQNVHTPELKDRDVVGVEVKEDRAFACVLYVRKGRVVGKDTFALEGRAGVPEILTRFLTQFYPTALHVPPEVVVPEPPADEATLADLLAKARGGPVEIVVGEEGSRAKQLRLARRNADHEATLAVRRSARRQGLSERTAALAEALDLPRTPADLAAIDVSHHAGREATGARVWLTDGEPDKDRYRHLHLEADGGDDPAGIAEVLERTLARDVEAGRLPDLVLVDGGRDQVQAAAGVVESAGVELTLAGLAKGEERLFFPDGSVVDLGSGHEGLKLLMQARDEAHRFANRLRRTVTSAGGSRLEEVPGVGPTLAARLLARFGDPAGVAEASLEELASVEGIGRARAETIRDALR